MNPAELRLLVASGPPREWLDPVRFISNPSTGRTGWSLATLGLDRFREVVFVSGPGLRQYGSVDGAHNVAVDTTEEMMNAVHDHLADQTLLIMSAAPADYTPAEPRDKKMKKVPGDPLTLTLKPTSDILKSIIPLADRYKQLYRVGFAAETNNVREYAARKLREKQLDFICANEVYKGQRGFGENENSLLVIDKSDDSMKLGPGDKEDLARELLNYLIQRIP